jgi:hypothetical protein
MNGERGIMKKEKAQHYSITAERKEKRKKKNIMKNEKRDMTTLSEGLIFCLIN